MALSGGQEESQRPRPFHLSEHDLERIADAVKQGIEESNVVKEKPSPQWSKKTSSLVVVFILVFAWGLCGFFLRWPQNATFRGTFASDTQFKVATNPVSNHTISTSSITALHFFSNTEPVELHLPMMDEERDRLARELGTEWTGNPVERTDLSWKLDFTNPIAVRNNIGNVNNISISTEFDDVRILELDSDAESGSSFVILVKPVNSLFWVTLEDITRLPKSSETRKFALRYEPVSNQTEPNPYFVAKIVSGLGDPGQVTRGIKFEYYQDVDFDGEILGEMIEVRDVADGVLAIGSVTYKLSRGESLELRFDKPKQIHIKGDRIIIDNVVVKASRLNGVVELLPRWFTIWPDWLKTIWVGLVTGTGVPALVRILKRLSLWPV